MVWLRRAALVTAAASIPFAASQEFDPELVGTWTTSSRTVFTGPDFYNPVSDSLQEPQLPGISYSFTSNGWYEEAYYRASSNPTTPSCPSGVLQWQHGQYTKNSNGSLSLTPIAVDGRMLASSPCVSSSALYSRYSQWELFKWYEVLTDEYHGVKRLNLYKFDGSPMNPMYLAYSPTPQMLPTQTLNPTSGGSSASPSPTSTKRKRAVSEIFTQPGTSKLLDPDRWWWFGIGMTVLGAFGYFAL